MSSQKTTQKAVVKDAGKFKSRKQLLIPVADFDITKWDSTKIDFEDEKNKNSNQFTCYGRYDYGNSSSPIQNQLVFRTGPIKIITYGIPQLGQYAKTDKDRCYIKIPYDTSQESCVELFKMFQALDTWALKNKDNFFTDKLSKFAKIYDYTPIVRKSQDLIPLDDDGKESKVKSDKPMYAKIKINTDWQSGEVTTTVFVREDGVPVKQEVSTVSDMAALVTWQSTIQMIGAANKLWFGKSADKTGRRQYGIAFKLLQCEVTEKVGGSSTKSDFTSYAFDDTVKVEEKEEIVKTVKTVAVESDSESDSEDEKPVSKQEASKPTKVDSDSEESDEEPVAKGKKPVAKSVTKKPADSESESESEDEKPAPKVISTKKPAKSGR